MSVRSYGSQSRERIVEAAQRLFAERGLEATSMTDIAAAARLSRATVFNQFGSKRMILDAITARPLADYRAMLRQAMADEASPTVELIRGLFTRTSRGLQAHRLIYREVFTEIRKVSLGLDAEGESPRLRRETYELLEGLMARGQARGELTRSKSAQSLATAFDSFLSGATTQWLQAPSGPELTAIMADMADILLDAIAVRPGPCKRA